MTLEGEYNTPLVSLVSCVTLVQCLFHRSIDCFLLLVEERKEDLYQSIRGLTCTPNSPLWVAAVESGFVLMGRL